MDFAAERIEGINYRTGKAITVMIKNGMIHDIQPGGTAETWIGPGLVDLQVNGFRGMDFNRLPISAQTVSKVTTALWEEGVTSYLPTVITNSVLAVEAELSAIAAFVDKQVNDTIPGIHLEGPFLSKEDGPRGAHDKAFICPPDWELFLRWQEAAKGMIRLVTISPEWDNAPEFIEQCVASGVKVALGHTAANSVQIERAVEAGASLSTHLGNGSHSILPRHPNYIWAQLANDRLCTSMIADGYHLPPSVLKVIHRVKGERCFLVSDTVSLAGLEPGEYKVHVGGRVMLTRSGKLHLLGHPERLAGSAQSLRHGVETLLSHSIARLPEAWEMASIRASAYLNLPAAHGLKIGSPADLVRFELENEDSVRILQTIKAGKIVYDRSSR